MDTPVKKKAKVWHPQQEKILKMWGEACACYRYMHYQAYLSHKKSSMRFTLPIIVISTVTGTANFAQSTFPAAVRGYVPSVIGAFNLIAGIMATVLQFLKINELMESFRVSSVQYGKLSRSIRLELSLPLIERSADGDIVIEQCRAEFDRLIEQSPQIPGIVVREFTKEFGTEIFTKPEIANIQPIEIFDAIMEHKLMEQINTLRVEERPKKIFEVTRDELKKELENIRGRGVVAAAVQAENENNV